MVGWGLSNIFRPFAHKAFPQNPALGPWSEKAAPLVWRNSDFAAVSYLEPRPTGPCCFSLNRDAGKVAGKVLKVDPHYRYAKLLI